MLLTSVEWFGATVLAEGNESIDWVTWLAEGGDSLVWVTWLHKAFWR